ncbi:MAG: hypothetical protein GXP31_10720 [Kiritimatiellaeota bacterium]|nr:hypothetical protein [Kiritimatiellota bacterium]
MQYAFFRRLQSVLPAVALLYTAGASGTDFGKNSRLDVSGYVKEYSHVTQSPVADSLGRDRTEALHLGRTRLRLRLTPTSNLTVTAAWELLWSSRSLEAAGSVYRAGESAAAPARADDLHRRIATRGRSALYQDLDRLALQWHGPAADIVLGRQAISFGSGRVFNPTDILTPFGFTDVDKEEKPGVDALRLTLPLASLADADLIYVAGRRFDIENSGPVARLRANWAGTDAAVLAAFFRQDLIVGVDLAGSLFGAGWWFETAATWPADSADPLRKDDPYWRLSTGVDRQLTEALYGFVEYDFISFGATGSGGFPDVLREPAVNRGLVTTLGRHYLTLGFRRQFHPLLWAAVDCLANLSDPSALFSTRFEWSLGDEAVLAVGAYLPAGRRPRPPPVGPPSIANWHDEFGAYPRSVFLQLRLYF